MFSMKPIQSMIDSTLEDLPYPEEGTHSAEKWARHGADGREITLSDKDE